MRRGTFVILLTSAMLARGAGAGQVFVNVNASSFQNTSVSTRNTGDHVIWRWIGSGHTVTSGNTSNGIKDGVFDTSPTNATFNAGTFFSWKTTGSSPVNYFCIPHRVSLNMKGSVVFPVALTQEADLRISEVRFDGAGNFIEIVNLGDASADLVGFRISINGNAALTPWTAGTILAPGQRIAVLNPASLTTAGSVALYVPNTISNATGGTSDLQDARMMIDYVEWGAAGGQPLESVAAATATPNLWTTGDFAPQAASGHSIVFCGIAGQYGRSFWDETTNPTQGAANDCVNPVTPTTWGRIKTLYR